MVDKWMEVKWILNGGWIRIVSKRDTHLKTAMCTIDDKQSSTESRPNDSQILIDTFMTSVAVLV